MKRFRLSWPLAFVFVALLCAALVYLMFDRIVSWPERAFASFTHESAESIARLHDLLADTLQFRPKIVVHDKVVYAQSQEIMQLAVLAKDTEVTRESDQSWLGSTKHIRIHALFRLHAGFDLNQECQVAVKGTTVNVRLPPASILSTEVVHWNVEELEDGLWNKVQPQDVTTELNALPEIAREKETTLPREAQEKFQRELAEKLKPLGYQVKVRFEPPSMFEPAPVQNDR